QRGEAGGDVQFLASDAPFGAALGLSRLVELAQPLAQAVALAFQQGGQDQGHGGQAAGAGQGGPEAVQRQDRSLGRAQVGESGGDLVGPLVQSLSARHGVPPAWSAATLQLTSQEAPVSPRS